MTKRRIAIDGEKLRKELDKIGVSGIYASKAMGYAANYLSNCGVHGDIAKPAVTLLNSMFNIPYEAYKATTEEQEEEKKQASEPATLDYDELYKVIYSAVYDAVKKAWNE